MLDKTSVPDAYSPRMALTREIREYMAALAKLKARKMTAEQRSEMARKMSEARWGKAKGKR